MKECSYERMCKMAKTDDGRFQIISGSKASIIIFYLYTKDNTITKCLVCVIFNVIVTFKIQGMELSLGLVNMTRSLSSVVKNVF